MRRGLVAESHGEDGGREAEIECDEEPMEEGWVVVENEDGHGIALDVAVARPHER